MGEKKKQFINLKSGKKIKKKFFFCFAIKAILIFFYHFRRQLQLYNRHHLFIHSFAYPFIHSFIHSFIRSSVHSFIHSGSGEQRMTHRYRRYSWCCKKNFAICPHDPENRQKLHCCQLVFCETILIGLDYFVEKIHKLCKSKETFS